MQAPQNDLNEEFASISSVQVPQTKTRIQRFVAFSKRNFKAAKEGFAAFADKVNPMHLVRAIRAAFTTAVNSERAQTFSANVASLAGRMNPMTIIRSFIARFARKPATVAPVVTQEAAGLAVAEAAPEDAVEANIALAFQYGYTIDREGKVLNAAVNNEVTPINTNTSKVGNTM